MKFVIVGYFVNRGISETQYLNHLSAWVGGFHNAKDFDEYELSDLNMVELAKQTPNATHIYTRFISE